VADSLLPLKLPPGLYRNGTKYQAKNRWYDGNGVRFIEGAIEPIGGWRRAQDDSGSDFATLTGVPRRALSWSGDDGNALWAVATNSKLYLFSGGVRFDITPAGFTAGAADTASVSASGTYGHGAYGVGVYGTGSVAAQVVEAGTWQLDNFGLWLAGVGSTDKKLYVWVGNTANPATVPANAPASATGVVVTPERFLVALGAGGDPRLVQWAKQGTIDHWDPLEAGTNAGSFKLGTNGRLRAGRRTKSETLLWTDCDVYRMTWIGGTFVYRFDQAGDSCGIIAPNAVAICDTRAFWMGRDTFWVYDGFVKPIPCDVRDYVFGDFNSFQAAKVWATARAQFGEVWWFYCSAGSNEINRYVVYNYRENHWNAGVLTRTAGFDSGSTENPIMADSGGAVYEHEVLDTRTGMAPYLESGPVEIGDGDQLAHIGRLVPDEKTQGDVQFKLFSALYPLGTETANGPYSSANPTGVRVNARQVRLRLDEVRQTGWRFGTLRLGIRSGARR
jgi:hypothetical protein